MAAKPKGKKKGTNKNAGQQKRHTVPPAGRARQGGVAKGGVPPLDAFDNLPKMPPPNLPGVHYDDEMQRWPEKAKSQSGGKGRTKAKAKGKKTKPDEKQEKRNGQRAAPQKARRRRKTLNVAVFLVFVVGCVTFLISMMLKIQNFVIIGESPYTDEEIIAAFGREAGDNLIFSFRAGREEESMEERLPYLEDVQINRRPLDTVVFRVTVAQERYYVEWEDQYAILSPQRKVLGIEAERPEGLVQLTGVSAEAGVTPGHVLDLGDEELQASMDALLEALDGHVFGQNVTRVDISDPLGMSFVWQGRITVKVGSKSNMQVKLDYAYILLTDQEQSRISDTDVGTLDVSGYPTSPNAIFTPG